MPSLMRRPSFPELVTVVGVASLWLLFPAEARADAIDIGFVAVAGLVILVPLMAFEVFVEAIFLALGLKVPYHKVLLLSLVANLASLAAGIPVVVFNAWMYSKLLPHELAPYFRAFPWVVSVGAVVYFVVTLLVEALVVFRWRRKHAVPVGLCRVILAVVVANAVTYSVLAPLHYFATRPEHDIREFTDDTRWARRPVTELYYVDGDTRNLCSITTDGRGKQVLIPDTVRDYQFRPDAGWFLYRNGSNSLCLWRKGDVKPRLCWETKQQFMMKQVACNAAGTLVAYLDGWDESKPFELTLYSPDSGRRVPTGMRGESLIVSEIAWSRDPSVLFVKNDHGIKAFRIHGDLSVMPARPGSVDKKTMVVYFDCVCQVLSCFFNGGKRLCFFQ